MSGGASRLVEINVQFLEERFVPHFGIVPNFAPSQHREIQVDVAVPSEPAEFAGHLLAVLHVL